MENNNLLIVISGPSGVGKGVLIKTILPKLKSLELAISATTRPIRKGENDQVDYYFYTKSEFDSAIKNNQFMEWCMVHDHQYGTLKKEINRINMNDKIGLVEIDTKGAQAIKTSYPEALSIFIAPPTIEELKKRLENRKTETEQEIKKRIKTAKQELKEIEHYDYVVINDNILDSSKKIEDLIIKSFNL